MGSHDSNQKQFQDFINVLFPKSKPEYIEIRGLKPGHRPSIIFFPNRELLIQRWGVISRMGARRNVYIGVCPRALRRGDKESIRRVCCFYVDVDAKDFSCGKEEALKRIMSFRLKPSIIVDSGNGYHVYWLLREPIKIQGWEDIKRVESHLKWLVSELGADKSAAEIARILRLPGTWNLKDPKQPLPVRIIMLDKGRTYLIGEFGKYDETPQILKDRALGWEGREWDQMSEEEHNRNQSLAEIIGSFHRRGVDPDTIWKVVRAKAREMNLTEEEARRVVKSITSYERSYPSPSSSLGRGTGMKGPLVPLRLQEFIAHAPPIGEPLVEGLLPKRKIVLIVGLPEAGKSILSLEIMIELARPGGGFVLGQFKATPVTILFIDEESSDASELVDRFKKMLRAKGLQEEDLDLHILHMNGLNLCGEEDNRRLREVVSKLKPQLVVIDSLIRVFDGDENSSKDVVKLDRHLQLLVHDFQCSVLMIDHMGKAGYLPNAIKGPKGSIEKIAVIDLGYAVRSVGDERIVEPMKSRWAPRRKPFKFKIRSQEDESIVLEYIGETEATHENKQSGAMDFIRGWLSDGQWHPRLELVALGQKAGTPKGQIDKALHAMVLTGKIESEVRERESGPGGKPIYYRLNPEFNS